MDQKEISKLETLFHALLEIPRGSARNEAAVRLSGGDAELVRQALSLVASDEKAAEANQAAREAATASRVYGNYRTVRLLGSGGMGAVYLAERADGQFQQTVAVKVIAPHAAGEAFRERFLAERQILAGLSHPNIAKLLDGGVTEDGTPYLVIEYVDGQALDRYCDAHKMDLRGRLTLFRKVCEPVAYAHRNLVVHRDLKPSNILVTAEGQPMLLDFGTAKLLADIESGNSTLAPLLTLRYSSPEQRRSAPNTTSTDVFSLGVILYELLTGAWPFGDPSSPEQILQRFARETPMTTPETSVTEEASEARSSNPRALQGSLAGDLTSILSKALAPAPELRYESVQALSADIGNWLAGMPVTARPASFAYRAGKFLRRRWLPVAAAAVFLVGLLGAALFAVHQAAVARAEARKAERVSQFLDDMLSSASEYSFDPQKFTVAQMLDAAEPRLERRWKDDPSTEATLRLSLGSSYVAVQRLDQAKIQLEKARASFHKLGNQAEEARTVMWLGLNSRALGRSAEAGRYFRDAMALLSRLGKNAPPMLVFRTKQSLAEMDALLQENPDEARKLLEEAIDLAAREPSIPRPDAGAAQSTRGAILLNEGKYAEAERVLRQSIATFDQAGFEGVQRSRPLYYLVILNSRTGNFAAAGNFARQYYEVVLKNIGPDHVGAAEGKLLWARYRADTGETKEAVAQVLEAMPVVRKSYPPLSINLWTPLAAAAHVMNLAGRFAEAEADAREELDVVTAQRSPEVDGRRAQSLYELGAALEGQKKHREAMDALDRSAGIYERLGPGWAKRAGEIRKMIGAGRAQ